MDVGWFVGRGDELSRLADLVADVSRGVGGVVLVEGEQGIGKTSLLRVGLAGAAGCRVFWGAADELLRQFPLQLMIESLDEAAAGPSVPAPVPFGSDLVVAVMERLLAQVDRLCAVSPVVLVTEDLQWADEASVLMWHRLSRAVGQLPLLLAGSVRSGSGRADLEQLRRSVTSRGGAALTLGALPVEDMNRLVAGLLGGPQGPGLAEVTSRAGGNPLYARELTDGLIRDGRLAARHGEWDLVTGSAAISVPASLAGAIADRIAGLDSEVVDTLRWGALLGPEFAVTDLSIVTGRPAGELMHAVEAAVTAGVLTDAGSRLEFRHGVIRQALYEGLPAALRVALHLQAARSLATSGAEPERVAAQLVAAPGAENGLAVAGRGQDWAASWLAANAPALIYRAPQAAAELLRDLLARLPDDDERRLSVLANLVRAEFQVARNDQVERTGAQFLYQSGDPDLSAEMAWLVSYSQLRAGRPDDATSTLVAALAMPGMSDLCTARLEALRGMILAASGELAEADSIAPAALELARNAGDPIGAGYALHAMSVVAIVRRDNVRGLALCEEALAEIGDEPQANYLASLLLANKVNCLLELDRFSEAITTARQEVMLVERTAIPRMAGARYKLASAYFYAGQWDDAMSELEPAIGIPGHDFQPLLVQGLIALIAVHRDDRPAAAAALRGLPDQPMHAADLGVVPSGIDVSLTRAAIAEQDHGPAAAAAVLAPCLEPAIASKMTGRFELLPTLARLAIAVGDDTLTAAAAAAAEAEAAAAAESGTPEALKQAVAERCRGLASGDPGPVLSAANYFAAVSRPLMEAEAREDAAVLLARQGAVLAARRALTAASRIYAALGARWDLRRAAGRLRPFGVRPLPDGSRHRPATGWAALTPTELRVARLVAQGRSNPDIAGELFLSRNTVQTHVSHILAKLGARSRAEVIVEALRHPLAPHPETAGRADRGPHQ